MIVSMLYASWSMVQFTSPAFSVAATLSKLETTGPGQIMVMSMPDPSFSDLRDSKYP